MAVVMRDVGGVGVTPDERQDVADQSVVYADKNKERNLQWFMKGNTHLLLMFIQ